MEGVQGGLSQTWTCTKIPHDLVRRQIPIQQVWGGAGGQESAFLTSSRVRPELPSVLGQVPSWHRQQGGPPTDPLLTPNAVCAPSTLASGTF